MEMLSVPKTRNVITGEAMSGFNSGKSRRRLSLFASGSVAVASVLGLAGIVVLTPTAAHAANECGVQVGTAALVCTGTFPSVSYPATTANLTLTLTNGPTVTTGGLSVAGTGAHNVRIDRNDTPAGSGDPSITNTSGAGIFATTTTGTLNVNLTDGDTAGDTPLSVTGTTYGAQLQSGATGGTAINLTFTNGSITATGPTGVGVSATTTSIAGGNLTLNLGGAVSGSTGVRATSNGTGTISVNVTNVSSSVLGGDVVGTNGPAIQVTPGANATVAVGQGGRTVRAANTSAVIEFTNVNATRTVDVRNEAGGTIRSNDTTVSGYDDVIVSVLGGAGNSRITNAGGNSQASPGFSDNGVLIGRVSLLNTGNASIENRGVWLTVGVNTIGAGSSAGSLTNTNGGPRNFKTIATNAGGAPTSFVFGDGADTFNNNGILAVGIGSEAAATLVLSGLETWTNSGTVLFGSDDAFIDSNGAPVVSDRVTNDRISAQGTAFTGTTAGTNPMLSSTLVMDVDFAADQADCSAAVTADCLDLRGGSAQGSTAVDVQTVGGGFAERIVLVDAAGAGTSSAGAFSISPASPDYRLAGTTPTIESGMFLYTIEFDDTAKQYALTATGFSGKSLEIARYGRATSEPWRTATGMWHSRQADLHNSLAGQDEGAGPGVWLKLAGNFIEETRFEPSNAGVEYETSASQDTTALVGGVDLVSVTGQNSAWVVGVTAGKLTSTLDYRALTSVLDMEGYSLGAYASLVAGGLFVDAIINSTNLDLTHNDFGQEFETSATSLGYQVEAGYRLFTFDDGGAYIEPLAAVSYVETDIDDLAIGPVATRFDEATSLRGALGVRMAGAVAMEALTAQFSFTGRVWREMEDENRTAFDATFASDVVGDALPETLSEVGVAIGLFTLGDRLSANLGYGVKFADDYQATDASISLRYSW